MKSFMVSALIFMYHVVASLETGQRSITSRLKVFDMLLRRRPTRTQLWSFPLAENKKVGGKQCRPRWDPGPRGPAPQRTPAARAAQDLNGPWGCGGPPQLSSPRTSSRTQPAVTRKNPAALAAEQTPAFWVPPQPRPSPPLPPPAAGAQAPRRQPALPLQPRACTTPAWTPTAEPPPPCLPPRPALAVSHLQAARLTASPASNRSPGCVGAPDGPRGCRCARGPTQPRCRPRPPCPNRTCVCNPPLQATGRAQPDLATAAASPGP
ncbi:uncharacterized protein LOC125931413 [Panthera uncia]|uniref:uncharacterized protein LOC125931413 n=1 Tax=Panthera uncia TaxID=29064 RepID=UPI0020FF7EFE|nr:uncharacterized protein LOC125931413 [Panthera uncia]